MGGAALRARERTQAPSARWAPGPECGHLSQGAFLKNKKHPAGGQPRGACLRDTLAPLRERSHSAGGDHGVISAEAENPLRFEESGQDSLGFVHAWGVRDGAPGQMQGGTPIGGGGNC